MSTAYAQLLEHLFSRPTSQGAKRGLAIVEKLSSALDFPHRSYPCIHIAGSNGKGSVATKIARGLQAAGHRVGLYTSPHLFSFRERISINSLPIEEAAVETILPQILNLDCSLDLQGTFFELTTVLALEYFRSQQVAVAVIETGLGGRLDPTNIVDPILTAITSISREHAHVLGEDLETIAKAKAGILKPGICHVLGPNARQKAIYDEAKHLGCPLHEVNATTTYYDEENSAIARQCLELLSAQFNLTSEHIAKGLEVRPPCRFEKVGRVIFDVAHNPDAFRHLAQALKAFYPGRKHRFLIGLCQDKEHALCFNEIAPLASHIYFVLSATSRAATPSDLALALQGKAPHSCHEEISPAVHEGLIQSEKNQELLVVTGSFYLMLPVKQALESVNSFSPVNSSSISS